MISLCSLCPAVANSLHTFENRRMQSVMATYYYNEKCTVGCLTCGCFGYSKIDRDRTLFANTSLIIDVSSY
jgi:hypothetical protein